MLTAADGGRTLSYQYDAASNRTRITWPDTGANALYVAYVYDVLNRVTQIEENGAASGPGLLASYRYDSLGRRSSVARAGGSGAATAYGYDGASRLCTLAQTLAGSASVTYTLGYNAANQIVTRQVSNSAYVANPAPITAGYTANGLNQYTAVTGITASYVAANQATLPYDPTGALQTETTAGATTTLLYDGANLVGEYSSSGSILDRYVPGPGVDEPVLWRQGAGTSTRSWRTADNQGSIIGYADQSGNSGATYTYGPYGEPITSSGASAWGGSRYRFTGQIEIPEAQLYFYKARMYDPAMGRFYQTDPVASDPNPYAYALGDPVNLTDPLGQMVYTVPLPGGGFRICDDSGPYSTEGTGNAGVGDCEDYDVVGGGDQAPGLSFGINGGGSKSATQSKPQIIQVANSTCTANRAQLEIAVAQVGLQYLAQGNIVTPNVTFTNPASGASAVADLVISHPTFPPDPYLIIEVKTGGGQLERGQPDVYGLIGGSSGSVIPRGFNALRAGFIPGQPVDVGPLNFSLVRKPGC